MLFPEPHSQSTRLHFPADGPGYANVDRGITEGLKIKTLPPKFKSKIRVDCLQNELELQGAQRETDLREREGKE